MTTVMGYNGWVRSTIMEEGLSSFVLDPTPTIQLADTNQRMLPLPEHLSSSKNKLTDVLMTVILNIMTEGVAI